jgi:hypothetical protein
MKQTALNFRITDAEDMKHLQAIGEELNNYQYGLITPIEYLCILLDGMQKSNKRGQFNAAIEEIQDKLMDVMCSIDYILEK